MAEKPQSNVVEDVIHDDDMKGHRGNAAHVDGNALLINKEGSVRWLPVPSNDPYDPLSFPTWIKCCIIVSSC